MSQDDPSPRCVNCGGYAYPEQFDDPKLAACDCEGDYAPPWRSHLWTARNHQQDGRQHV